jgi:hypothetical protein
VKAAPRQSLLSSHRWNAKATVSALIPAAPAGWTLEDSTDDGVGSALAAQMLGGGLMVERSYTRGDDSIKATLIVDSPMIQALAATVNNPAMMGAGAKRVRIAATMPCNAGMATTWS